MKGVFWGKGLPCSQYTSPKFSLTEFGGGREGAAEINQHLETS